MQLIRIDTPDVRALVVYDDRGYAETQVDEQADLVTLMWLGRDDSTADDWAALREEAVRAHNEHTAEYLLGTPLLGDFLEEGLSKLGYSCEDYEINRL